jgi:hypothetical protein
VAVGDEAFLGSSTSSKAHSLSKVCESMRDPGNYNISSQTTLTATTSTIVTNNDGKTYTHTQKKRYTLRPSPDQTRK